MDISELQSLPIPEQLEIIGKLWDGIIDSEEAPITLSPIVIAEIDRRRAELASDPSTAMTRDEMWQRVNESRKSNG